MSEKKFKNKSIQEMQDLKEMLKDFNEREKTLNMLKTILSFEVNYLLLIEMIDKHIQREKNLEMFTEPI
jgi:hypothetical protein